MGVTSMDMGDIKMKKEEFQVTYTNKDIMEKLEILERKIDVSKRDSTVAKTMALTAVTMCIAVIGWTIARV